MEKTLSWTDKDKTRPKTASTSPQIDTKNGIRLQGFPDSTNTDSRESYEDDLMKVNPVFNYVNVDCELDNIRRVGNYSPENARTMIVNVRSKHFCRQILLSVH